ncbi:MAG: formate dehydrogenase family accessory protein FdhD [Cycloclasticus sp.]|nr:formate dehydrogenase family accessory protein FdhD [Cycloclasticus sp.]MBG97349.1 formate dehydrogenase family accessory protein FdhD [Cycloclasticus sp.]HAI97145.1 formate dehydrogenase accessory sulfurtransferase FdhD [Methylococcaceae bacterium]|tara:strand:- start:2367 stop:3167 length:801 start_codon:yes stop_codon:yes gene_type:complete
MIEMTRSNTEKTSVVSAINEKGDVVEISLVEEKPLTIFVDKEEVVTLMTMGAFPELLVMGYLRNQLIFNQLNEIKAVQVDWETEAVAVVSNKEKKDLTKIKERKTITTGCGQGTMYGDVLESLNGVLMPKQLIKQTALYALLKLLADYNKIYKTAGAVHGCALCKGENILFFVEDVGRHNAVDTIAGYMWLNDIQGGECVFYTTGRLTSEMVIKVAQMGVPILLSRSGATKMGFDVAKKFGVTLISRAKGRHFNILNGIDNVQLDA